MVRRSLPAFVVAAFAFVCVFTVHTPRASAYAWMIRHGYTGCATCHVDPSGGSLPTAYGRAQGMLLMTQRWGFSQDDERAVKQGQFLYGLGADKLPEWLNLGGDVRGGGILVNTGIPGQPLDMRGILMQGDVAAAASVNRFRSAVSLGIATSGAFGARVVGQEAALVSRYYWAGAALGRDEQFLLRAGRINLPYGLRMIEHTSYVRQMTRTDINASQQHGVAFAYTGQYVRAEVMGILGNYQISPDAFRERGYSGYLEVAPTERFAVGVSSLVTHAKADIWNQYQFPGPVLRVAEGGFLRYSPREWVVFSAEGNYVLHKQPQQNAHGGAVFGQIDFEPIQGLHLIATGEWQNLGLAVPTSNIFPGYGGWASIHWFFLPHLDFRIDAVVRRSSIPQGPSVTTESLVGQIHAYF